MCVGDHVAASLAAEAAQALDKANARIAELEGLLGQVHTAATDWAKGSKIDGNKLISDIENALPKEPKT